MSSPGKVESDSDIVFYCQHCKAELVVSTTEHSLSMHCTACGKLTGVPRQSTRPDTALTELGQIQRQLVENESQRAEVTGYINQLTIQLHRWQLRVQTLDERKAKLEKALNRK